MVAPTYNTPPNTAANPPPLKKGFRRNELWYLNEEHLTKEGREKFVEDLYGIVDILYKEKNPIRWEEVGVFQDTPFGNGNQRKGDTLKGLERHDYARRVILGYITWRIATIIRFTYPLSLKGALKALEISREMHQWLNPTQIIAYDPIFWIYYCAAREETGKDITYDLETVSILNQAVLFDKRVLGPKNFILGCCVLARLYRRIPGNDALAQEMIAMIANWFITDINLYKMTPYEFRQNIDEGTMARVISYLGRDPFAGLSTVTPNVGFFQNVGNENARMFYTTFRPDQTSPEAPIKHYQGPVIPDVPLETDKRSLKPECWLSGCRVKEGLKRCSSCQLSRYCCKEHQKEAWPRHKSLCDMYNDQQALYKDLD